MNKTDFNEMAREWESGELDSKLNKKKQQEKAKQKVREAREERLRKQEEEKLELEECERKIEEINNNPEFQELLAEFGLDGLTEEEQMKELERIKTDWQNAINVVDQLY